MAVIDNGKPVFFMHPFNLRRQCGVIGGVVTRPPPLNLLGVRGFAVPINWLAVEIGQGAKPGGILSGVKAGTSGVAVDINDIAMHPSAHAGGIRGEVGIKAVDMPVGISKGLPSFIQVRHNAIRQLSPAMGQAQNKRTRTLGHVNNSHSTHSNPAALAKASPRSKPAAASISAAK